MAATRKLLAEIQQTLKKVEEGVLLFDDIWEKVYAAGPQALKEKYEGDLKKEIKKLQRLRDQIKTWIGSNEVKDKSSLMEARKTIETKMEQFKVCEKDTKTKAFSKEGLARQAILDPTEVAKEEKRTWINECLDQLNDVINTIEAEKEKLSYAKGNKSKNKEQLMFAENRVQKNKWHINKLEHILKLMDNGLDPIMLDSIKDSLDYYIESAADDDGAVGVEDEYDIYEDLEIDFDAFDVTGSTVPARGASSGSASADASPSSIDNITATPDISAAPGNGAAPAKSAAASTVQSLATRASPVKASAASTAGPVVSIRTQASVPAQTKAGTDRKGVAPTVASTGVAPTSTIAASIEACPVPAPAPVPTPVPTPGETTTPAPVSWAHAASVPQASTASAKASTTSQSPPLSAPQASSPLSAASQGVAASSAASLQQLPVPNTAQPAVPAQPSSPYNGDRGAAAPESSSKLTPVEAPVSVSAVDVTPSVTTPSPSVPSASSSVVTQPSNPPQQKLNPGTNSQINPDMMVCHIESSMYGGIWCIGSIGVVYDGMRDIDFGRMFLLSEYLRTFADPFLCSTTPSPLPSPLLSSPHLTSPHLNRQQ